MTDLWWTNDGFMVDKWWIYGGKVVDLWWKSGGQVIVYNLIINNVIQIMADSVRK